MQMDPDSDPSKCSQILDKSSEQGHNITKENETVHVAGTYIVRPDSAAASSIETSKEPRTWKTSFFRLAPLAGIFCMVVAVGSVVASLGILIGSRGAAVNTWAVPPSTYLAICTAIANQALRFAAFQGLAIAWWFRATHGSTLSSRTSANPTLISGRQLHYFWRSGMTASGAIVSGRNMGLVGLACLACTFVAVDGPLLQKGTTIRAGMRLLRIEEAPIVAPPIPLTVNMAQEVPTGRSGGWVKVKDIMDRVSPAFNETIPTVTGNTSNLIQSETRFGGTASAQWFKTQAIPGIVHGCPSASICKTRIRAPAFAATSCISEVIPVDYWAPLENVKNIEYYTRVSPPFYTTAFIVDISLMVDEKERLNVITGYGRNQNCSGTLDYTICTLEAAVGEYEVLVGDDGVTLADPFPRIIALANNTGVDYKWSAAEQAHPSTLAGIFQLAHQKWEAQANHYYVQGVPWLTGWSANVYHAYMDVSGDFASENCWSFNDPHEDVIGDLNYLMFLAGAEVRSGIDGGVEYIKSHTDPGLPVHTTIDGYLHGHHNVFRTNLHWFGIAAAIEFVCIALILPTYYGWWKLGRSVSFSPLETAKAFEAPLLRECNSNSTGGDIAKAVGDVRIQYGQTTAGVRGEHAMGNQTKLAFADPATVVIPREDSRLDY